MCNEEDSNDDIYFMDEFGNYVFPVSSPNNVQGTSCSCPPSAEELNSTLRRVSQVRKFVFSDFVRLDLVRIGYISLS